MNIVFLGIQTLIYSFHSEASTQSLLPTDEYSDRYPFLCLSFLIHYINLQGQRSGFYECEQCVLFDGVPALGTVTLLTQLLQDNACLEKWAWPGTQHFHCQVLSISAASPQLPFRVDPT